MQACYNFRKFSRSDSDSWRDFWPGMVPDPAGIEFCIPGEISN